MQIRQLIQHLGMQVVFVFHNTANHQTLHVCVCVGGWLLAFLTFSDTSAPEGCYSALWFCNRNLSCSGASMYSALRLRYRG